MRKFLATLATFAVVLVGRLTVAAAPAQAVPTDCSNGTICLYLNGTNPYARSASST